jgi:hypothetical protein
LSLSKTVNNILNKMHSQKVASDKGSYGEEAVFSICEDLYQRRGGILIHSYSYKTERELAGNIKREGSSLYVENTGSFTEIDILLITPYKIYPIEVKAYKAKQITLTNDKIVGCSADSKSPVHQNEMHMRHLYPKIFTSLPDGQCYEYIVPIVVFADETLVVDSRSADQREYMKVTILNQFRQLLEAYDKPHNNTLLDVKSLEIKLRSAMTSYEKFLPYIVR